MWMSYTIVDTDLGQVGLVGSSAGLRRVVPPQSSPEVVQRLMREGMPALTADPSPFGDLPNRLRRYLRGEPVPFEDQLDLSGRTRFSIAVLQAARAIPYGHTLSYSDIAQRVGSPEALRAVGQVLARNPLPIVIPCHRVIGKGGRPLGTGEGLKLRRRLLDIEATA